MKAFLLSFLLPTSSVTKYSLGAIIAHKEYGGSYYSKAKDFFP